MITRLLLDLFLFVFGICLGIVIAVAVARERVKCGTLVYKHTQTGEWQMTEAAYISIVGQVLHPEENMAEWEEEDDRPTED